LPGGLPPNEAAPPLPNLGDQPLQLDNNIDPNAQANLEAGNQIPAAHNPQVPGVVVAANQAEGLVQGLGDPQLHQDLAGDQALHAAAPPPIHPNVPVPADLNVAGPQNLVSDENLLIPNSIFNVDL
jgi:hypothetical protein